jgi:hypothetical protein
MPRASLIGTVLIAVLCLGASLAIDESSDHGPSRSLANLLTEHGTFAFLPRAEGVNIWIVSDGLRRRAEEYYAELPDNRGELEEQLQQANIAIRGALRRSDEESISDMKRRVEVLHKALPQSPLQSGYKLGRVTSSGTDFIEVTAIAGNFEYLYPISRIRYVRRDT